MVNGKDSCPSEASNISTAASEGLNTNYNKPSMAMKMKEKVVDDQGAGSQSLDLKLFNRITDLDDPKVLDRNLLKNLNMAGLESSLSTRYNHHNRDVDEEEESKEKKARPEIARVYTCNFCKREFSTSQALGGHQSAHKQERAIIAKRRQGAMELGEFGNYHPYNLYSFGNNYSSTLSNNCRRRASGLGVRFDSLIHKTPSYPWSSRFAHSNGWSRASSSYVSPLQPSLDHRINNIIGGFQTNVSSSNTTSSARFCFLGSKFEGSGDSASIISATNIAVTKAVGGDGIICRGGLADSKQVDASPEIDLSLKL